MAMAIGLVVLSAPALTQYYREYYIRGRVLDVQKQPISGVEIRLLDVATSRSYNMKTDKDGIFKFAGLPHGVYKATFSKEGYPTTTVDWKFESPQDTMQRIDIPDIVLASEELVQKVELSKATEAGVKEAAEKVRQRDFDGAITQLEGILDKKPKEASALFFLGLAYVGKQKYPEALGALEQVAELNPTFPGVHFELGVCHRQLKDREKALAEFEKSLELEPSTAADAAHNAGLILFEDNRIDEALAVFDKGLAAKPQDADLLEMTGRCYIHQGKLDKAVDSLEKARAANTDAAKVAFLDELIASVKASIK
jgi:Flp pilus assembly protein TadD